ncbi:MAG: MBL fold metallo-hydrolase [Bacteroidetes bacterium]|nr:MBL fold metallo-hydrolase [Bacteroidota bacterium]
MFVQRASVIGLALLTKLQNVSAFGKPSTKIRLLRHATLLVTVNGKNILVDPMLSKKEALDPIQNAANSSRIPMVELPINQIELNKLIKNLDAVLVTHLHRDHWDITAQQTLPKEIQLFCQPGDEEKLRQQGFKNVQPISGSFNWSGIQIHRTDGRHGTGEIEKRMGIVSGFVVEWEKDRLYIAGDTIWCDAVDAAIKKHQPTQIIINGGGAQFITGDPITMTVDDMVKVVSKSNAQVVVVHLETINHCYQRRPDFRQAVVDHGLDQRVIIPNDGDVIKF